MGVVVAVAGMRDVPDGVRALGCGPQRLRDDSEPSRFIPTFCGAPPRVSDERKNSGRGTVYWSLTTLSRARARPFSIVSNALLIASAESSHDTLRAAWYHTEPCRERFDEMDVFPVLRPLSIV